MKSRMFATVALTLSVGSTGVTTQAMAAPQTFSFSGYIDYVSETLPLDGSVTAGVPFSGSYTFDPEGVSDSYPDIPGVGFYDFPDGWMGVSIGNYEITSDGLGILIWNDRTSGDLYQAGDTSGFFSVGIWWSMMRLVLQDTTRTALDSDALPLYPPDVADFGTYHGLVFHTGDHAAAMTGVVTSLVPEPGMLALLGAGAAWLMVKRHRFPPRRLGDCRSVGARA